MSRHFDVIVVGVGTMGAATCWMLARRGVRVLGLERWGIPNHHGSHHGQSRVIRKAYSEHPDYVPLLERAYENWALIEAEADATLMHRVGGVYMGRPDSEIIAGSIASMQQHHLPHEQWTRQDLAQRYPVFQVPDEFIALHDPDAGFILPERAVAAFAGEAMRRGGELHGHEPVTGWSADAHGVTVTTAVGRYHADRVVFCGGAWSGRLLRALAREPDADARLPTLTVTRQIMGWVWPPNPEPFRYGRLPVWLIDDGWGGPHYGLPMMPDRPGLKLALHRPAEETDPDRLERQALPGDEATFRPILEKYLPDADGPLLSIEACLYTSSPDGHFILDRHPHHDRVVIACGFSGHGFKFASVIGEALADLATQGASDLPIDFLAMRRLSP
ncbi:MAG: N-methyl-L-tryptophan oxidase [Phycisphaeraceae bacterium]